MEREKRYTITLDDDPMMAPIIAKTLGIPSIAYVSSEVLLRRAASYEPVAAFVDIHLGQGISGLDAIAQLRSVWKYTPIIIITSGSELSLIGDALASGANDFLRKPLQSTELLARLQARLAEMNRLRSSDEITLGDLTYSKSDGVIEVLGKRVYLPNLESKLFMILLENRDIVVFKETLKRRLWGDLSIAGNTLDKRISKLRSFLLEVDAPVVIEADYGKGFCLRFGKAASSRLQAS